MLPYVAWETADLIKGKNLENGGYPELSGQAQYNHKGPQKYTVFAGCIERKVGLQKNFQLDGTLLTLKTEKKSHEPKNAGNL